MTIDVAAQRRSVTLAMAATGPVAILLWLGTYRLLPDALVAKATAEPGRFALGCACLAILFCFAAGIEAVAHRRLFSPAIDPLAGAEDAPMRVDQRYLQHTLEQLLLFLPGLFGLAAWLEPGPAVRAVAATTLVWIVGRYAFWIGYHQAPRWRAIGLAGMVQSILVLLWVAYRFGEELAGPAGGAAPLVAFAALEAVLLVRARR